jgi:hypothetical protein
LRADLKRSWDGGCASYMVFDLAWFTAVWVVIAVIFAPTAGSSHEDSSSRRTA